jgi:hypothetical protein
VIVAGVGDAAAGGARAVNGEAVFKKDVPLGRGAGKLGAANLREGPKS